MWLSPLAQLILLMTIQFALYHVAAKITRNHYET